MATYAIGDVQGCCDQLEQLLEVLRFTPARDELWFVGDLVNRGPRSLDTLRLIRSLGSAATVVLGNHDLHLIALAFGNRARAREHELADVLAATDAPELIDWLRHRPLACYRPELNTLMVHAGVPPGWDPLLTVKLAREVEKALRGPGCASYIRGLYGDRPQAWSPNLEGQDRLRFITNCLTRMRYCHTDGTLDFRETGPPRSQPPGLMPWFDMPDRQTATVRIVFGHWAALGLLQRDRLLGIDTGCVWGRQLTAVRLDGPARVFSVPGLVRAH
ncbi:MAG: symmetrical bis(5'-nucleosyl)-tetraphosphatase [Gammaproteobacteria bacterium]|nr:symmetrical bis(5'-nucleosyl)-tetraphosphatase [Gammaproteobacteria bacterium]